MPSTGFTRLDWARLIAILTPTVLLGGAFASQLPFLGGLQPCEMCWWQRWPHMAAIFIALDAIAMRDRDSPNVILTARAALAVIASGTWGMYDAGVTIWPWVAGILAVLSAVVVLVTSTSATRSLTALAALAIAASGAIGAFHAGVEYHWWQGVTGCTAPPGLNGGNLADIMAAPVIRCDVAQFVRFGISLAGYNAILSLGGALVIFLLLLRRRPA